MNEKSVKSELTAIAKSRLAHYRKLIALADAQREFLIGGKYSDLVDNLREHDPILVEIGRLDKREETLAGMLTEVDLDPDYKQILRETAETAALLAKLTRINAQLLENARDYITFSLGIITKSVNEQQSADLASNPAGALLLDQKV